MDLFSVILSSGISWGINRILNSITECFCSRSHEKDIVNVDYNLFRCPSCSRKLNQFINASDHTVNKNGTITSAAIHDIHWPSWRDMFKVYFDLDVINSKYEAVVVEMILSRFNGPSFERFESLFQPNHEYSKWSDHWIKIPNAAFPEESCIVAVDFNVYNTWGDILDKNRSLMKYGGK